MRLEKEVYVLFRHRGAFFVTIEGIYALCLVTELLVLKLGECLAISQEYRLAARVCAGPIHEADKARGLSGRINLN